MQGIDDAVLQAADAAFTAPLLGPRGQALQAALADADAVFRRPLDGDILAACSWLGLCPVLGSVLLGVD